MSANNKPITSLITNQLGKLLEKTRTYTPDVPYLNQFENHFIFVYGSLKRGCQRGEVLTKTPGCKWAGIGVTDSDKLDLMVAPEGNFPVAIEYNNQKRNAKLKGEVWLVPTEVLIKLDEIEANGFMFQRTWRKIWVGPHLVDCFCYLGKISYWQYQDLLDLPTLELNNKRYHSFNEDSCNKIVGAHWQLENQKNGVVTN